METISPRSPEPSPPALQERLELYWGDVGTKPSKAVAEARARMSLTPAWAWLRVAMVTGQHHRLDRIYRAWKTAHSRRWGSLFREFADVAFLVGLSSTAVLFPLDLALWGVDPDTPLVDLFAIDGSTVAVVLIVIGLLQGICFDMRLRALAPAPRSLKRWILWLRPFLAGVPLFGLFVLPIWYEILRRRPSWAFGKDEESSRRSYNRCRLHGLLKRRILSRGLRVRWFSHWYEIGFFALGLASVMVWAEWLMTSAGWVRRSQLLSGLCLFHGTGFAGMAYAIRGRSLLASSSTLSSRLLPLLSLAWLVPIPGIALSGFMIWVFVDPIGEHSTLTRRAFGARERARKPPRLYALEAMLRSSWQSMPWWRRLFQWPEGIDAPLQLTETTGKILLLCRMKSVALFFEGALLALVSLWLIDRWPGRTVPLDKLLTFLVVASLTAGIGASFIAGIRWVQRLSHSKRRSGRPPYGQSLVGSQLSLFFGLFLGDGLYRGDANQIRSVMLIYAGLWMLRLVLPTLLGVLLPVPQKETLQDRESLVWIFGFAFIALMGLSLGSEPVPAAEDILTLEYSVWLVAFLGVLASILLLPWMLRPFKVAQIFSGQLPWRTRAGLLFLGVTTLMPLGGLAVPGWLYLRHHKWTEYERQQSETGYRSSA